MRRINGAPVSSWISWLVLLVLVFSVSSLGPLAPPQRGSGFPSSCPPPSALGSHHRQVWGFVLSGRAKTPPTYSPSAFNPRATTFLASIVILARLFVESASTSLILLGKGRQMCQFFALFFLIQSPPFSSFPHILVAS